VDHPNLQVMRRVLDAFRSGDIPALSQLFSKDIVWHVPGKSVMAGDHTGQKEVFGFFGKLMEMSDGTFRVESIDMTASGEGGVFVDRIMAERGGKKLDVRLLLYVRIKDGQIVEGFDHFHQEHLWDAFWQ
jgi:ketosteroid isomerase-like protein